MHETALALGLVDLVAQTAKRENAQRVRAVTVEIGALSHVEPEALIQAFVVAAKGGVAETAALEIERPPGEAQCMGCGQTVAGLSRGDACPMCGSYKLLVTGGDQMRLKSLEIV
jgi:hydrogenase nickel incorporation protein HypA/HybF